MVGSVPTAFASTDELDAAALGGAPVRWPRPSRLEAPVAWKPRPAAEAAEALGLTTVGALLDHIPRDSGEARTIGELVPEETATVIVEVRSISSRPVRRRGMKPLVEAVVSDATGVMKATFFNQPWLKDQYKAGTRLMLAGKYQGANRFRVNSHARTDAVAGGAEAASQYPATKGITSTQILAAVREHRDAVADVVEPLPAALRVAERLPDRAAAFAAAHFGDREAGRARLAFDELLVDQVVQLRLRAERRTTQAAMPLREDATLSRVWRDTLLPFTPTGDQATAMDEIDADLAAERPMQRLLMGEVGSGKTVVALHAMLRAVEHDMQAAMMAPTETLAEQHFATLQALMPGSLVPVALLTGSTPAGRRADLLGKLRTGELKLIVGTHALIEEAVEFERLAVAVVDEQHRFGVRQRAALDAKAPAGLAPHVLHMTATPIPRTLRLAAFGALDVTTLRELPKGRQPIETHVVGGERERERAYERIREELRAGHQAFVVCPLVSESEALQARAATAEFERLQETEFADFRVVLLHGQMRPREKAAAMEAFANADPPTRADVLVATTVIEVGIDVPNATVMLVEDAERYGISQLHQLRGRVGRGQDPSLCLLFGPGDSPRLKALARHSDGFELAAIDLELRGEGELTGTRQSGLARFRFARLPEDAAILERAHARATALLREDPGLRAPELALLAAELEAAEKEPVAA
jgi:ATP-dependent DNA helicase RecG